MNKYLILMIFSFFFISSCNKKEELPLTTVTKYIKSYGFFKKDSYWIYKNDSTGIIDSAYVSQDPEDYIIDTPESHFEVIITTINSSILSLIKVSRDDLLLSHYNYEKLALSLGLNGDYSKPRASKYYKYISFDSTFILNDRTYYNVITSQNIDTTNHSYFTFYWSPKVGLIKLVTDTDFRKESWSLVRYDVKQ